MTPAAPEVGAPPEEGRRAEPDGDRRLADLRQLFEPVARRPKRRGTPAAVVVLGMLAATLLLAVLRASERRTMQDLAIVRTINELEAAAAYWHLWLEEHLTGDRTIDLNLDVRNQQIRALQLAGSLVRGGRSTSGETLVPPSALSFRQEAAALQAALEEFRDLSEERLRRPLEAGVGTPMDQTFDAKFKQVRNHAQILSELIDEELTRDRADFRHRVRLTVAVWISVVALAAAGLWRRELRRREAEERLRTSQKWLATTLASIGDAVVTTDLEGRIFFMNPKAEKMTGWRRREASGRPIDEVFQIVREDGSAVENPVAGVLRSGEAVSVSDRTVMVDRTHQMCFGIDEGAAPIRDDSGELLGVVLVFRDVGRRRRTEKALRQREAELQQARKMEAVGRLAGGIAHDVNNYLGAIRGSCEVAMLKGESGEALTARLRAAVETADKVSALIRQLLAFSRQEPLQSEVVDLNRVVADVATLMERLLGEDVAITTRLDPGLAAIEIDPSQIEQALVNLLVNARDAMPTGGAITVETAGAEVDEEVCEEHPAAVPGRYVKLAVSDTGDGIPPEAREKIFDPFFTTKAQSGSSGLGLATVYAIVRRAGGFLTFDSEVGAGTRFDLYLPATDAAPTDRRPAATRASPAPAPPARVLLVEDHEDLQASTRALLETLGHQVEVAASGEEALERLDGGGAFDLLITDVILPGLSGRELYDAVVERRGETRCLFISGYTDDVTLRHGVEQERVHFLQKPFGFGDLEHKIAEILGEGEAA